MKFAQKHISLVSYLIICLVIALPFNSSIFKLIFTEDNIPAGADAAFHTFSVMKILDTGDPLISYTAFPPIAHNNSSFYPSLMHLMIAGIAKIPISIGLPYSSADIVLDVEKSFMITVSLLGTIGYAILMRLILCGAVAAKVTSDPLFARTRMFIIIYPTISVLAFGIFIYSVSPVIKTFNDGTYAQLTAMWLFFPYFMSFLLKGKWVVSAILLAVIASIHNLSFLMSLAATLPYLISTILTRKNMMTNLIKFISFFLIIAAPALILFYLPSTTYVLKGDAADSVYHSWPQQEIIQQITPGLYYAGTVSIALLTLLNYRNLGWITGWALIYFVVFNLSSELGARFGRELSVVFGLATGVCIAYVLSMFVFYGKNWIRRKYIKLGENTLSVRKAILLVCMASCIIAFTYLYFQDRIYGESNPNLVKYSTEMIQRSNKFFLVLDDRDFNYSHSDVDKNVIVLFGENPWLKVTTHGMFDVLPVQPDTEGAIGEGDKQINSELFSLFINPDAKSSACILQKYDIDYIYVSDLIHGRWYPKESVIYHQALQQFQNTSHSEYFKLEAAFHGDQEEYLRIYSVTEGVVKEACNQ